MPVEMQTSNKLLLTDILTADQFCHLPVFPTENVQYAALVQYDSQDSPCIIYILLITRPQTVIHLSTNRADM